MLKSQDFFISTPGSDSSASEQRLPPQIPTSSGNSISLPKRILDSIQQLPPLHPHTPLQTALDTAMYHNLFPPSQLVPTSVILSNARAQTEARARARVRVKTDAMFATSHGRDAHSLDGEDGINRPTAPSSGRFETGGHLSTMRRGDAALVAELGEWFGRRVGKKGGEEAEVETRVRPKRKRKTKRERRATRREAKMRMVCQEMERKEGQGERSSGDEDGEWKDVSELVTMSGVRDADTERGGEEGDHAFGFTTLRGMGARLVTKCKGSNAEVGVMGGRINGDFTPGHSPAKKKHRQRKESTTKRQTRPGSAGILIPHRTAFTHSHLRSIRPRVFASPSHADTRSMKRRDSWTTISTTDTYQTAQSSLPPTSPLSPSTTHSYISAPSTPPPPLPEPQNLKPPPPTFTLTLTTLLLVLETHFVHPVPSPHSALLRQAHADRPRDMFPFDFNKDGRGEVWSGPIYTHSCEAFPFGAGAGDCERVVRAERGDERG